LASKNSEAAGNSKVLDRPPLNEAAYFKFEQSVISSVRLSSLQDCPASHAAIVRISALRSSLLRKLWPSFPPSASSSLRTASFCLRAWVPPVSSALQS